MAMTEEEKLRNKAAKLVRDRAYNARCYALQAAIEAVKTAPAVVQARLEEEKASDLYERARSEMRAKEDDLRAQIAALEEKIRLLTKDESLDALNEKRKQARDKLNQITADHIASAKAAFPDLKDGARWSVSLWKIPPDVVAAMEAARANPDSVLRAPRKKRDH
jgi:DNA repair exonuclease SbcCD ATPase subunit